MADSSLSPYVAELLSSASPSLDDLTPSQAGFCIDFKAIEVDVVAAIAGEEEDCQGWYKAACAAIKPHLLQIHKTALGLVREGREAELQPFLSWTSHPSLILDSWRIWDGGERLQALNYYSSSAQFWRDLWETWSPLYQDSPKCPPC